MQYYFLGPVLLVCLLLLRVGWLQAGTDHQPSTQKNRRPAAAHLVISGSTKTTSFPSIFLVMCGPPIHSLIKQR